METWEVKQRDYQRPRDARVALIRCSECKEYYETSVRQARRIQKGENGRLCPVCRKLEEAHSCTPDQTEEYATWWLNDSGLSRREVIEIASMVHPGEARRSEPSVSPSRRLTREESNSPTPGGVLVGARLRFSFASVNVSTAS